LLLLPANVPAWQIVRQFGSGLICRQFTGKAAWWGPDLSALDFVFRVLRIPAEEQPAMLTKIMAALEVFIREEVKSHG